MYFVIAIKFAKESQKISHALSYDYCNRWVLQSRSTLASFGLSVAFVPELREFKFRSPFIQKVVNSESVSYTHLTLPTTSTV